MKSFSPPGPSGLLANSTILTLSGEMRVGDVRPGHRIVTRNSGTAVVRAVLRRQIRFEAIRFLAGSLGDTRPDHDTILPAGQGILIRDWRAQALFGKREAVIPADRLVDGEFVTRLGPTCMTLCDIAFDRRHVLYVDGFEVVGQVTATVSEIAA
ncbi:MULTISPECIES: Hint domain-containing protein [unclassified Roseovarius]|uniref:Hint domain-containing protein n=1 Tax=unclassified Roseovarius TaxID=2614913 RepID=UPI00274003CA|nr:MULTISPECIES: Hint domain-containing protein [unclassified Roseovarius]